MKRKANPVARRLREATFRPRVVKARKGKGSYIRRPKHERPDGGFLSGLLYLP